MMIRLRTSTAITLAAFVLMGAAAPTTPPPVDASKVTMQTTSLGAGVAVIFGSGGNVGVSFGPDGTVLVDDQYAPLTPKLIAAAQALDSKPVRFVVNTHYHFDHSGGNENFGNAGTVIVAQDNVRTRMSAESAIELLNLRFPASPAAALPIVTFSDGMTFHLNGDTLHVFHTPPGHTDGDSMIKWEKNNVLHTGDVYVSGGLPIVDYSAGGTTAGMIAALDKALSMTDANTKIIPGHGPVSNRAELTAHRDQLKALLERVTVEVKAGKSLEQILALKIEWAAASGGRKAPADNLVKSTYLNLTRR
jgi:cyclase